jgi:flagellar basal body-associated protein FliL
MMGWTGTRKLIEKNGLLLIAIAIILFYWTIDIITEGTLANRILITIAILAYGIITQYLLNEQKAITDSLQQSRNELAQANEQLEHVNKKLELAYAWMRDNRDELRQQMYDEDIGFLVDQDGKIEGVSERAPVVMEKSRDAFAGTYMAQLMPESAREEVERELKQAWKGISHQMKSRFIMPGGEEKEFELKFTRLTVSGKKRLLVILN